MNGEIKRRTRVVQVFPSPESLVRLVGAVCCDQNDAWLAATNFMDPRTLAEGYEREPLPAEPGGEERVPEARQGGVRQEGEGGVGLAAGRLAPAGEAPTPLFVTQLRKDGPGRGRCRNLRSGEILTPEGALPMQSRTKGAFRRRFLGKR